MKYVFHAALRPDGDGLPGPSGSSATTLALSEDGGDPVVTDRPFAEPMEQLGGACLLECADPDEALAWARKISMRRGQIQMTPVAHFFDLGCETPTPPPVGARA